ncbi:MAG: hypothetical protein C0467_12880 [Planctomycetaceae bacterium]|nr:hypothetical protein [Planctomycetaceae bacterium]
MPSDTAFRLSLYLTLSLACLCVGYAERDIFPEVPFIAAGTIVVLAILYRLESRVEFLTIPDANRLGLVVGLMNLIWAAFRITQVMQRVEKSDTNIQHAIVALFGPLLMTLIPAKLSRREQHVGDYWALQAMGLVAVSLSGAMAEDPVCSALIALYAFVAVWSLTLFHLRRTAGIVAPIPNGSVPRAVTGVVSNHQTHSGLWPAVGICLAAVTLAVPVYLVTPRSPGEKLEFGKPRVEIGYAASQMIDLNQAGNLQENPAPAFEVSVTTTTGLFPGLPHDQLWRGRVLRNYSKGTWEASDLPLPGMDGAPRSLLQWTSPHLGPGQVTLTYNVPSSLPGQFLAEPIVWAPDQPVPVASITVNGPQPWLWGGDGSFLWSGRIGRHETHHYVQVWQPGADSDLSPRFHIIDLDPSTKIRPLIQNPVRRAKDYGDTLVNALIHAGQLPEDCRDPVTDLPRPQFHDKIAVAFTRHLATSPDFNYTTKLRRTRKDLDPIEEFLFHTKAGHCERFASALAMLLRSQGIPAVLVLGFKGWESTDHPQRYVVKQEHAHAWVDALIVEYEPAIPERNERPVSRWRTLDPTPGRESVTDPEDDSWTASSRAWLIRFLQNAFSRLAFAQRRWVGASLFEWLERWGPPLAIVVAVLAIVRWRRSRPVAAAHTELLTRLFAVLSAGGYVAQVGDTPREFVRRVSQLLAVNPTTALVAGVPGEWVDAYYESRFGGRELTPERLDMLDAGLRVLKRSLKSAGSHTR